MPANCGGFDVHTALAKHGDIVLILLGMNDILKPTMRDDEAVLQTWKAKYRELLAAIRHRVTPREIVLCEITPLTEDPLSPKNRVRDRLNQLAGIAQEEKCRVADTGRVSLRRGGPVPQGAAGLPRDPRHGTPATAAGARGDHPGNGRCAQGRPAGRGLRRSHRSGGARSCASAQPCVTCWFKPQPGCAADRAEQTYRLTCFWQDGTEAKTPRVPTFALEAPQEWSVAEPPVTKTEATFTLRGVPERLQTPVTIVARAGDQTYRRTVQIPAPWRVVCGPDNDGAWTPQRAYRPAASVPFMEADLVAGRHFCEPFTDGKKPTGGRRTPRVSTTPPAMIPTQWCLTA